MPEPRTALLGLTSLMGLTVFGRRARETIRPFVVLPLCAGTLLLSIAAQATPLWVAVSQTDTQSLTTSYEYYPPPSNNGVIVPVYSASITPNQVNPNYNNSLQSTFALPYGGSISGSSTQSLQMSDTQIVVSVATLGSRVGSSVDGFAYGFVKAASSLDLVFRVIDPVELAVQYDFNSDSYRTTPMNFKDLDTGQIFFSYIEGPGGAITGITHPPPGTLAFTLTPGLYELQAGADTYWSDCCDSSRGGSVDLNLQASPVPEPGTALLVAVGAVIGVALRRPGVRDVSIL